MSILRRYKSDFNIYFVTNVTFYRKLILQKNGDLLMAAIESLKNKNNIDILAFVILPDHFHILIDTHSFDISKIMQKIKMSFGVHFRIRMNINSGRVWQHRFWDHAIRNQDDLNNHIDYIHYNPVKHGYTHNPFDWEYSSIHGYFQDGYYSDDWGRQDVVFEGKYGE